MGSGKRGIATSGSEVISVGPTGFWLLLEDREYFMPFEDYPFSRGLRCARSSTCEGWAPVSCGGRTRM
jgi:hypothetical protein